MRDELHLIALKEKSFSLEDLEQAMEFAARDLGLSGKKFESTGSAYQMSSYGLHRENQEDLIEKEYLKKDGRKFKVFIMANEPPQEIIILNQCAESPKFLAQVPEHTVTQYILLLEQYLYHQKPKEGATNTAQATPP
ncbi:hypothetical protein KY308_03885 [Candidatus Woesearchaeota archaeon]|nr:hypothetical protein [Candidatus Woesearchaeota archaeon]